MITIILPEISTSAQLMYGWYMLLVCAIMITILAWKCGFSFKVTFPTIVIWFAVIVVGLTLVSLPCTGYQMINFGDMPSDALCQKLWDRGF